MNGTASNETGYATSVNVADAISWLGTRDKSEPWLLWMAFNAPHIPFHKPPNELHDYDHLEANEDVPGAQADEYYLAMLQALDTEIGRLLDHLRATKAYDNTLVIFLGDNGSARPVIGEPFDRDHAKDTLSEGGAAVPFVISGPGIKGGRADTALVSVVDVFATVLETAGVDVAGATADNPVDSQSLWPLLLQSGGGREQMLTQLFGGQNSENRDQGHAIRDTTHKLICRLDGTVDLFDLSIDRWESTDLYVSAPSPGLAWPGLAWRAYTPISQLILKLGLARTCAPEPCFRTPTRTTQVPTDELSGVVRPLAQGNTTASKVPGAPTNEPSGVVKEFSSSLNPAAIVSRDLRPGQDFARRDWTQELDLKPGRQDEDIIYQGIGGEVGRIVQSLKINHPVHRARRMVEIRAHLNADLRFAFRQSQARSKVLVTRCMGIHLLELSHVTHSCLLGLARSRAAEA